MIRVLSKTILMSSCLLALTACGQKSAPKLSADASPIERVEHALSVAKSTKGDGDPTMWKMSDDDTTIYIYGTVHILKPETKWETPEFNAAFDSADTLYVEADITNPESMQSMQKVIASKAAFTDGESLRTVLTADQYNKVNDVLVKMGAPAGALDGAKPWAVGLQILMSQMATLGYDPESGVDPILIAKAKSTGKAMGYFETATFQAHLLSGGTIEDQVESLMFQIETMEKSPDMLELLVDEWVDGDNAGLGAIMGEPAMYGNASMYNAMMKDRNKDWIPKIENILDKPGTVFVAVGAGHLAGPDSVITMLQSKGHKVETVQ